MGPCLFLYLSELAYEGLGLILTQQAAGGEGAGDEWSGLRAV